MKKQAIVLLLLLLLFCIPAIWSLIKPGFYEPHDLHHIADIYEMYRAFESGQIPPRLGPDFIWGWGYPLFNFYYVLPFYIGAAWFCLTKSLTSSFEFVFILSVFISVFGMYLFLKEFFGRLASFTGSILYLYTPYRALQIYVRGAMGEALGLAIAPVVFWIFLRLLKNPTKKNIGFGGIVIALFILSHNYLWLLIGPFLAVFVIVFIVLNKKYLKGLKALVLSLVLGAGLSFYWWFPAIHEYKLVSSLTPFIFEDHFPFIKQLIVPSWGYGNSVWGPGDGMSFQIGLVNLGVVIASFGVFLGFRKRVKDKNMSFLFLFALFSFLISVFMMNIRTLPVWKILPIINFVQFPWRLLILTTFFTAILASFTIKYLPRIMKYFVALGVVFLSILFTFNYFKPSQIFFKSDKEYLDRMFDSKSWSEDYLLLPTWSDQKPNEYHPKFISEENAVISKTKKINPVSWVTEVTAQSYTRIKIAAFYFPGWYVKLNGSEAKTTYGKPYGQIELNVPQGNHEIELYWAETNLRLFADFVSLISLAVIVLLIVLQKSNPKKLLQVK